VQLDAASATNNAVNCQPAMGYSPLTTDSSLHLALIHRDWTAFCCRSALADYMQLCWSRHCDVSTLCATSHHSMMVVLLLKLTFLSTTRFRPEFGCACLRFFIGVSRKSIGTSPSTIGHLLNGFYFSRRYHIAYAACVRDEMNNANNPVPMRCTRSLINAFSN